MATVCANCGTSEGPFVRDAANPGLPICGYPARRHANEAEKRQRTADCNSRRDERDRNRYPVGPNS